MIGVVYMAKKIAKRGNGEGYIKERGDKRWEARISLGIDFNTKKPIRKSFYGKTRKEVQQKMEEAKAQISTGTFITNNKLTLGEWMDNWLNIYPKHNVRIGTWESYETYIRVHIKPTLGNIPLKDLRPMHLQRLYNEKLISGRVKTGGKLSPKTVGYIHVVIHMALEQAVRENLVNNNVARLVKKPKQTKHEIYPLTVEQMKAFLDATKSHRFYVPFLLECHSGLRRGELLGIRWQDINFETKAISVNQSLIRTRQKGLVMSDPKTEKSKRTIPIADEVIEALKGHKAIQNQHKLLAGRGYNNADLVFCSNIGNPIDPRNFTEQFERAIKQANLPRVRFHDMRHSHATMLLLHNVQPKIVQDRLGHSTISMTMDTYSHILPGMQEEATEKVRQALQR
jgi:integrase